MEMDNRMQVPFGTCQSAPPHLIRSFYLHAGGLPERDLPTGASFLLDGRGAVTTERQKTNSKGLMQLINSTGLELQMLRVLKIT